MESLTTSARNLPKMSIPTLEVRRNYYVIPDGEQYHYFPIKVIDDDRPFFRFEKAPPVLMEGIALIGGVRRKTKLYRVPIQDLMRGIIRKSREINPANRVTANGSSGTATNQPGTYDTSEGAYTPPGRAGVDAIVQHSQQQGPQDGPEMEVSEAADLAWTEQIDALLGFISEKEGVEWEIADPAQS